MTGKLVLILSLIFLYFQLLYSPAYPFSSLPITRLHPHFQTHPKMLHLTFSPLPTLFYFSSRDLKALSKPWSSLTPWVIFCFQFPRWGGAMGHRAWGWVLGGGWSGSHGDPGPPSQSWGQDEGQALRWLHVVWFQLVPLRWFCDCRDSDKESELEKIEEQTKL